jgi:Glycosyl transferase family 2/Methyltransferase domain
MDERSRPCPSQNASWGREVGGLDLGKDAIAVGVLDGSSQDAPRLDEIAHDDVSIHRLVSRSGEPAYTRDPHARDGASLTWLSPGHNRAVPDSRLASGEPAGRSQPVSGDEDRVLQRELIPPPAALQSEYLARGDHLWTSGRVDEALAAYEQGLENCADVQLLHKRIAGLLEATQGLEAAFRYYGLERVEDREISIEQREILCAATVRDEADLLPYFLQYHEDLGVDRFLVVDNLSEDGTRELLLDHPKVHLWQTGMRYWPANAGTAWIEVLFRAFARGHWCLVVDPDELFYYPDVETRSLRQLCDELDQSAKVAMHAVLLDMYSDCPMREALYHSGQDPVEVTPFFDREFFHLRATAGPWRNFEGFVGGLRRRAFGDDSRPFLSKFPLFRYTTDRVIAGGAHSTNALPEEIASERGAVLHFKFMARFVERLENELQDRRSDAQDSSESYVTYEQALISDPELCLYDPEHSIRLRDSRQLVEIGVMSRGEATADDVGVRGTLPTIDEYLAHMHELVLGWFDDVDAAVFRAIDHVQRASGVEGDLLEIGTYLGKSAILLGYLLRPSERLVVCDLFTNEALDPDLDADAPFYGQLSRVAFEENYSRFHLRPATVIERSSTALAHEGLERSFRIVHVDGSHRFDVVRQDITTALDLVVDGGIVVIDDYRTIPHALGVAAAVWEAVTSGRLVPVVASGQKLYGCSHDDTKATARMLLRWASEEAQFDTLSQHVAGHDVVVFAPPLQAPTLATSEPSTESEQPRRELEAEVAQLRERLALIEGSRTWRLRNKLVRHLRRGPVPEHDARD